MATNPPRRQSRQGAPSERRFEFITVTGRDPRTDAETRRRVHRHAQANYRRQHPYRRRQTTVDLDITPLMDGSIEASSNQISYPAVGPVTLLGSSRMDPFDSFGLDGGRRAHRLWDHGKYLRSKRAYRLLMLQNSI